MNKAIILSCIKHGDFTLCSGQKSKYLFDVMKLIRNEEFLSDFYTFTKGDFIVGVEFGGSILASINTGYNKDFAIIRKDGTIYGNTIPKDYVLLDDVVTTEGTIRKAMKYLHDATGHYPDEIKCIVDRRNLQNKSLHIESMLKYDDIENTNKFLMIDEEKVGDNERMRLIRLRKQLPESQRCSRCHNPLFDMLVSSDTEPYKINGEPVCRKCYFGELGEMMEEHFTRKPGTR